MQGTWALDGGPDTEDIPQQVRRPPAPITPGGTAALTYYVSARKSTESIFGPAGVGACTEWARREAVSRSAPLDVREIDTGVVLFGFNAKGKFG